MAQTSISLPHHPGSQCRWGNLSGTSSAYAISLAAEQCDGLLLIITPDSARALALEEELHFFLKDNNTISVLQLPDWETLPYDSFSPHQDIISERLATLHTLSQIKKSIIVSSVTTLAHKVCPKTFLDGSSLLLRKGDAFNLEQKRKAFEQAGYRCVDSVYEHGEFAIRGALIDIFPMGSQIPFRIDLFDEEVDSIRTFDVESQRSVEQIDHIHLLPAHEFPMDKTSRDKFRAAFRNRFDVDHRECPLYQDIGAGVASPGIEYYQPLFFDEMASVFDYLPNNTTIMLEGDVQTAIVDFLADATERYEERKIDPLRPLLLPHELFIKAESLYSQINTYPKVILSAETYREKQGQINFPASTIPNLMLDAKSTNPIAPLQAFIKKANRTLLVAESTGRREALLDLLKEYNITPVIYDSWHLFQQSHDKLGITVGPINDAFQTQQGNINLVPESCLLGQRVMQKRRRSKVNAPNPDQIIRNLTELRLGSPVVHVDHGVGRYRGLKTLGIEDQQTEFLTLEYADEAKLYVPVDSLHLIVRYSGSDESQAPLHRMGSDRWSKARKKAAEKARDVAAELLDVYARREALQGVAFDPPDSYYFTFAAAFPFEETPDQQQAISAVINDMCALKPMDRLVCGDVGFGKTEVAMRAAFLAAHNGKQVAILVPTTLLAQQHYDSFRDRFAEWPIEVDVMSRFKSTKEINNLKSKLAKNAIDIIIGTHKLLQDQPEFNDLGLLIIDEEHRFGVRHKEKLKALRAKVDILTLTATPIPRTLNMAMSGMRDLSIIATPPARRLSIKTFIRENNPLLIKEAILRELLRGGQIYFLHNEVQTIEKAAQDLQTLIPEARIRIGHGQMRERELEQVMSDFYHRRFNVLVCTTIIETGIDIPNANTIIIHRADRFGLAQLHQLRGRVGRSHHQAYAYLLTPPVKTITTDARKRLDAISEAQDLGAGFMLASHDMEIRGTGELLGEGQSGQIHNVGFTLYTDMLERAVEAIRNGETPDPNKPLAHGIEINLRVPALLPESYIHDVHNRLILYKRIAAAKSNDELRSLQVELIDRFGLLPDPAKNLFRQTQIKLKAIKLGIQKLDTGSTQGRIEFENNPNIDPMIIIELVQAQPNVYHLEGSNVLKYYHKMETHNDRFKVTEALLKQLLVS
ncbi:MAG: transcription-repair coupling factor [Endozoicomonas sp. (ex Botrylloides leachii)]|nr:transcription-repair coupling factor [Endozoicomonas sp. (ex Botrylloides leachii)]